MELDNLMAYDKIVAWGAGRDFNAMYKKNIHLDYIVEKDEKKIGTEVYGIPIYPISKLEECDQNKKILIIIFTTKYYAEIVNEISKMHVNCDYISGWEYRYNFEPTINKFYGIFGVDAIVTECLRLSGYDISDMNYLEVGAAHPIFGSHTYSMYLKGARGVLVEPNPEFYGEYKRLRPEDVSFNCGIGAKNGTMKFYRLDYEYRGTFDTNSLSRTIAKGGKIVDEIDIEVKTLDEIIEKVN